MGRLLQISFMSMIRCDVGGYGNIGGLEMFSKYWIFTTAYCILIYD